MQKARIAAAALPTMLLALGVSACGSSSGSGSHQHSAGTQSAASACKQISATLAAAPTTLANAVMNPAKAAPAVSSFTSKLRHESASATPKVQRTVYVFTTEVQRSLAEVRTGKASVTAVSRQLTAASSSISRACAASAR
jgi:hypothetical protein